MAAMTKAKKVEVQVQPEETWTDAEHLLYHALDEAYDACKEVAMQDRSVIKDPVELAKQIRNHLAELGGPSASR